MTRCAVMVALLGATFAAGSLLSTEASREEEGERAFLHAKAFMMAHHGQPHADQLEDLKNANPDAYAIVSALLMKRKLGIPDEHHPSTSFAARSKGKDLTVSPEDREFLKNLEARGLKQLQDAPWEKTASEDNAAELQLPTREELQERVKTAEPNFAADTGKDPFAWRPANEDEAPAPEKAASQSSLISESVKGTAKGSASVDRHVFGDVKTALDADEASFPRTWTQTTSPRRLRRERGCWPSTPWSRRGRLTPSAPSWTSPCGTRPRRPICSR